VQLRATKVGGGSRDYAVLTVRSVLLALAMEYARHNGHADLLRQRIDGSVGY
jgi:hypothetical protein